VNIFTITHLLLPFFHHGNTSIPIWILSILIKTEPFNPFHKVLRQNFSIETKTIAYHFDQYFCVTSEQLQINAIYAEMNGFQINPDGWFFNIFAYKHYSGMSCLDWLSRPDFEPSYSICLYGMEELQTVYKREYHNPQISRYSKELCDLLVLCKFQDLIRRSSREMKMVHVPILATAHDYDCVVRILKRDK
jgi:hypothetical protein